MVEKYFPLFEIGAGAFGQACVVKDKQTGLKYVSKRIKVLSHDTYYKGSLGGNFLACALRSHDLKELFSDL